MNDSTRSKRVGQRPKTKKIRRHQDQPWLCPDRVGPVFANRQIRVQVQQRGKITPYGGVCLAHDLAMRLQLDRDINRSIRLLKIKVPYCESDHILPRSTTCTWADTGSKISPISSTAMPSNICW